MLLDDVPWQRPPFTCTEDGVDFCSRLKWPCQTKTNLFVRCFQDVLGVLVRDALAFQLIHVILGTLSQKLLSEFVLDGVGVGVVGSVGVADDGWLEWAVYTARRDVTHD